MVDDGYGSRSDQDERLPPPRPEGLQRNPEQLAQGSQSTARSLRAHSEQWLTQSQVFEEEVLPRPESTDQHLLGWMGRQGKNLIGTEESW
jgi:hypothetical protein